jgi:hypothetical protein
MRRVQASTWEPVVGLAILMTSLLLAGFLGALQETVFRTYGKLTDEAVFYSVRASPLSGPQAVCMCVSLLCVSVCVCARPACTHHPAYTDMGTHISVHAQPLIVYDSTSWPYLAFCSCRATWRVPWRAAMHVATGHCGRGTQADGPGPPSPSPRCGHSWHSTSPASKRDRDRESM